MTRKHRFFYRLLRPLVVVFLFFKFGYRYKSIGKIKGPYIVLANHTTDWDPLFVGVASKKQMYFVASEHIARWKVAFKFLKYAFDPIIRYKGMPATASIIEIFRAVKNGANVCMFAEGARTWDGVTLPISPATGKVIKKAKCTLVTYKIQGGYFVSPNWSQEGLRKGPICGAPVNIYTKEQLEEMSVEEINEIIAKDLYEDAYAHQLENPKKYKGKQIAYKMENLLFRCPECGAMDSIKSQKDTVTCEKCGLTFKYTEYCMLEGLRFKTVKELAAWQQEEVLKDAQEEKVYTSQGGKLTSIEKHVETECAQGAVSLTKDALSCGNVSIALDTIADLTMHGRRAIVFSTKEKYYELLPSEESNVLKFLLLYNVYKNRNGE